MLNNLRPFLSSYHQTNDQLHEAARKKWKKSRSQKARSLECFFGLAVRVRLAAKYQRAMQESTPSFDAMKFSRFHRFDKTTLSAVVIAAYSFSHRLYCAFNLRLEVLKGPRNMFNFALQANCAVWRAKVKESTIRAADQLTERKEMIYWLLHASSSMSFQTRVEETKLQAADDQIQSKIIPSTFGLVIIFNTSAIPLSKSSGVKALLSFIIFSI